MAVLAKVGAFDWPAGGLGGTRDISVGFTPKLVFFFSPGWINTYGGSPNLPTNDLWFNTTHRQAIGFGISGTNRFTLASNSLNASATTDANRGFWRDACLAHWSSDLTIDGFLDYSIIAGGFRITVDQDATNKPVVWFLALGDDGTGISNVGVVQFNSPNAVGNFDVTGFGFNPNFYMLFGMGANNAPPDLAASRRFAMGAGAGVTQQGYINGAAADAVGTTETKRACAMGFENFERLNPSGANTNRIEHISFIADGIRMNMLEADDDYLVCLGVLVSNIRIFEYNPRTTLGDTVLTGFGFKPAGGIVFTHMTTEQTGNDDLTNDAILMGAFDATQQFATAVFDANGLATSRTSIGLTDESIAFSFNASQTGTAGRDRVKSLDADGITFETTEVWAANRHVWGIAFGPALAAPAAPTGLTATATDTDEITLAWTPPGGTVTGYKIERESPIGGGFSEIDDIAAPASGYVDSPLSDGTEYNYRVRAYNAGGDGPYSNEDDAITPLIAPTVLVATPISPTQIDLTWNDNTTNEDEYAIERESPIGGGFAEIDTAPPGGSYSDTTVVASTQYNYRVRARNAAPAVSAYSNEANATTPAPPSAGGKITDLRRLGRITRLRG